MRYALLLAAPLLIAAAGDMSVATFLQKADALRAKGPLALMSGDIKVLMSEFRGGATRARADFEADKKAGRRPSACPPAKVKMNSNQILADMRAVPVAERGRTSVKQAVAAAMARRYPCRA